LNLSFKRRNFSNSGRDEHHKRSPDCTFFTLVNNHKQTSTARKSRAKKDRGSKASRYSTQSVFTAASEVPSLADLPPEEDDSVLTTTTNATATPGEKKMGKGKRTTTGRGRKTKAKKSEAVEIDPPPGPEDDLEVKEVPVPKATRGRKRKSEQIHDSTAPVVEIEAPAAKRRATRARGSTAIEDSHREESADQAATEDLPNSAEHTRTKRTARSSRKPSAAARIASLKVPVPTDEEIDAALQADLDMHVPDDEGMPATGPLRKATRSNKMMKADYAMFDTEPMDIDEAAIEAELEAMEADSKPLPKAKGARGRPRKASAKQQAAAKKAAAAESEAREAVDELASEQIAAELEHSISVQHSPPALKPKKQRTASHQVSRKVPPRGTSVSVPSVNDNNISQTDNLQSSIIDQNDREDSGNDTDVSLASQSTVVRATTSTRGSIVKRGVGKPNKRVASRNIEEVVQKRQNAPSKDPGSIVDLSAAGKEASPEENSLTEERFYTPAPEFHEEIEERMSEVSEPKPTRTGGRLPKVAPAPAPITASQRTATGISDTAEEAPISVPARSKLAKTNSVAPAVRSSTPPRREKNPSRSPQSSDAENQPPSSKPSTARKAATPNPSAVRIPLAAITPVISPSKLNIISSLRSDNPWTAVDLDAIFMKTPGDENVIGKELLEDALGKMKTFELTSPEKKMTVEEWVLYNAEVAEGRLRNECERMVGIFERQGTKAMRAVEGIECAE
jgi:hypothetical protein